MTLVWAFLIAAVLVSPFAYVTFRRILTERRTAAGPPPDDAVGDVDPDPALERDVGRVVTGLRDAALAHPPGEPFEVEIPHDATIGGRSADPALVVRLVVDDLRRSGVEVDDPGAGGPLRCRIP